METRDSNDETYETIPWAQLAPGGPPPATRIATVAVGVLVAAIVAYVLITLFRPASSGVVVELPAAAAPASETAAVAEATVPTAAGGGSAVDEATAAAATEERLFSEADLMAVAPEEEMRAAAALAEWFVTDYFTVDGDAASAASVRALLPVGLDVALPHDAPTGVSYVEWARAMAVRLEGSNRYGVDVAFRALAGPAGADLVRMPVRVLRVPIGVTGDGTPFVADLPEAAPEAIGRGEFTAPPAAEPPAGIVDQVEAAVASLGTPRRTLQAGLDDRGWRFVVEVGDASGLVWAIAGRP